MSNEQMLTKLIAMIVDDLYMCDVLSGSNREKYLAILKPLMEHMRKENSYE